jgi:hypothetical protein
MFVYVYRNFMQIVSAGLFTLDQYATATVLPGNCKPSRPAFIKNYGSVGTLHGHQICPLGHFHGYTLLATCNNSIIFYVMLIAVV